MTKRIIRLIKQQKMKQITHSFDYQVFETQAELPADDLELLRKAADATNGSYAPYSRYHVGAAIRMANGEVFSGSNQENMSFPAGSCAERVGLFMATATYPDTPVEAIAITARSEDFEVSEPVPPCGICRQAIAEYEMKFDNKIRIILGSSTGKVFIFNEMRSLLPLAFREKGLAK